MKSKVGVLAAILTCGTVLGACSGKSDTGGSGGKSGQSGSGGSTGGGTGGGGPAGTGGSSSGGGMGGSCAATTACGGTVTGTWTTTASCLTVSGTLDPSFVGLNPSTCTNVVMSGTLSVSGSWTGKADGTYTDDTTTTGDVRFDLAKGCLEISGTTASCDRIGSVIKNSAGFESITCTSASTGGCNCSGTVNQKGWPGVVSPGKSTSSNYTTQGNMLKLAGDSGEATYAYCVSGDTLKWSPQNALIPTSGTVTFQKGGAMGTGGAGGGMGVGGMTGTGGRGGMGGMGSGGRGGGTAGGSGSGGRGGAAGGTTGSGGRAGMGGMGTAGEGPCDIYAAANTPCVAAYSMVRVLNSKYTGPLYQVRRGGTVVTDGAGANMRSGVRTGGMTMDIGSVDGFGDAAAQDAFCGTATCTVSKLYDQSGNGNDLPLAPKGDVHKDGSADLPNFESSATKGPIMAGGRKVYSLYMDKREGYRLTVRGKNVPLGTAAQGIYMLADGTHAGSACCWDFGNVVPLPNWATMNTLFFGEAFWGAGAGQPPWFMADFEAGVWAGGSRRGDPGWGALDEESPPNTNNPSMRGVPFAFGVLKTQPSKYAIRAADARTATSIITAYEGALPKPMDNQGGVVLGTGGDNSNSSWGTFFEGAIVAGYPTDATELSVLKNIQAVGYSK